ncbi:MAG: ATP-binding protein [Elainellaceae cyanobacterium]
MKLRSFRLRLALLSSGLAGVALVSFGAVAWWLILDAKISRLDARLEKVLLLVARFQEGDRPSSMPDAIIQRELGLTAETTRILWIWDADGTLLYSSKSDFVSERGALPDGLKALPPTSAFPQPTSPAPPQPESRGRESPEFPPSQSRRRPRPDFLPNQTGPGQGVFQPQFRFSSQSTNAGQWRMGGLTLPNRQVAIAINLSGVQQEMVTIRTLFVVAIPGVLLLVAAGGWVLSSQALRPIWQLTATIQTVTAQGLNQRVGTTHIDVEFAELVQVFNQMLERLDRSFKQASRFSGDAAHELKTPLAILQGELEQALQAAPLESREQQQLSQLLDEVRRLSGIVRKLLLLSLADAGQMAIQRNAVDLTGLLREVVEDIDLIAPHLTVRSHIEHNLRVKGDRDLLNQVLQNLVSNAVKYNQPDDDSEGWIEIRAQRVSNQVKITLQNSSRDVSQTERDRFFDRFYRGDPSRNRTVEGTGLGLSLSREIVRAHGGRVELDPPRQNEVSLTVTFPDLSLT